MALHYSIFLFLLAILNEYFQLNRESGLALKSSSIITVDKKDDNEFSQKSISVPNLIGLTVGEAEQILQDKKLDLGAVIYESKRDSQSLSGLIIYKQNPSAKNSKNAQNYIREGKLIDVWTFNPKEGADTLKRSNKIKTNHDF